MKFLRTTFLITFPPLFLYEQLLQKKRLSQYSTDQSKSRLFQKLFRTNNNKSEVWNKVDHDICNSFETHSTLCKIVYLIVIIQKELNQSHVSVLVSVIFVKANLNIAFKICSIPFAPLFAFCERENYPNSIKHIKTNKITLVTRIFIVTILLISKGTL